MENRPPGWGSRPRGVNVMKNWAGQWSVPAERCGRTGAPPGPGQSGGATAPSLSAPGPRGLPALPAGRGQKKPR
eukprot:2618445-Pyramimonas_sp.AAC.1